MVSFVIPVRNDAARLDRCLRSIRANDYPAASVEIVVADNGSTDGSATVARELGASVLSLPGRRVGDLRNQAAASARGEILAFVDADHEIAPGWVAAAVENLADSAVVAVGSDCHPPTPGTWVQRAYDRLRRHSNDRHEVEWLGSGNMAVRRSAFVAMNGFDTSLETCEDVDLCRKFRSNGGTLMSDPRMFNVHFGDPDELRRVFFGELWRGRDNLRVSFRPPHAPGTIISALIPIANLACLVLIVIGVLTRSDIGMIAASIAAAVILVELLLRTARMIGPRFSVVDLVHAFAVAAAYDGGRALALLTRVGHDRRKGATT